jgi:hypothetical protein
MVINLESVRDEVISKLPLKYEPLLLSFYGSQATKAENWIIFGDDYGTKLHLSLSDGHIQSIDVEGKHLSRFMNSSIGQLSAFIKEYDHAQENRQKALTDDEQKRFLESFRANLKSIDASALDNPDNWWSTIIEQMEDGLL